MTILSQAKLPGSRSNRQLTQKVIRDLGSFFTYEAQDKVSKKIYGPIRVNYNQQSFEVHIKGNLVLNIDKENQEILVTNGNYFDKYNNPTSSTRELINGVFDALEAHNITNHVRVFLEDKQCKICVIDDYESYERPLDKEHCAVRIHFKK